MSRDVVTLGGHGAADARLVRSAHRLLLGCPMHVAAARFEPHVTHALVGVLEARREALTRRISTLEAMRAPDALLHKAKAELRSLEDELVVEKRVLREMLVKDL